jgi:hypothetical protein
MDLRLGPYRDALADATWDALICDPPYSERTHTGHDASAKDGSADGADRKALQYGPWSPDDMREFLAWAVPRTDGWAVVLTDHVLAQVVEDCYRGADRVHFAPVPVLSDRLRKQGDGPASGAVWLMASRPRRRKDLHYGSLPGYYLPVPRQPDDYTGGKPLAQMRRIVRDYSRPGDVVCDPCAGWGTTLIAAAIEGRRGLGAEMDAETHATALARYQSPHVQQEIAAAEWLRGMDPGAGQASLLGGEE